MAGVEKANLRHERFDQALRRAKRTEPRDR
jgi:hypothetical protein